MTQDELQDIVGKRLGTKLTATTDRYCSFDSYDDNYVIELKCRRTHYDTQLIEHRKYIRNKKTADESGKEFFMLYPHQRVNTYLIYHNCAKTVISLAGKIDVCHHTQTFQAHPYLRR